MSLTVFSEDFLKKRYPDEYFNLPAAFQCVERATDFPVMSKLLFEVEAYRGTGISESLFFDAKVTEAGLRNCSRKVRAFCQSNTERLQEAIIDEKGMLRFGKFWVIPGLEDMDYVQS